MRRRDRDFVMDEWEAERMAADWLAASDADDLARIIGEMFGGKCFSDGNEYVFTPTADYYGAFDEYNQYKHRRTQNAGHSLYLS